MHLLMGKKEMSSFLIFSFTYFSTPVHSYRKVNPNDAYINGFLLHIEDEIEVGVNIVLLHYVIEPRFISTNNEGSRYYFISNTKRLSPHMKHFSVTSSSTQFL